MVRQRKSGYNGSGGSEAGHFTERYEFVAHLERMYDHDYLTILFFVHFAVEGRTLSEREINLELHAYSNHART